MDRFEISPYMFNNSLETQVSNISLRFFSGQSNHDSAEYKENKSTVDLNHNAIFCSAKYVIQ